MTSTDLIELDLERLRLEPAIPDTSDRGECPRCKARRLLYCYNCFCPVAGPGGDVVPVGLALPIRCEIVHLPSEKLSKSSAVHCKVLAHDSTGFHEFPGFPGDEWTADDTVLLFPSDESTPVSELSRDRLLSLKRAVFVDSQWQRAKQILRDPRLAKLPRVSINGYKTLFWRYQPVGDHGLATVEAIYYFFRELETARMAAGLVPGVSLYDGRCDNLLWLFVRQYRCIQEVYRRENRTFTSKHRANYIKEGGKGEAEEEEDGEAKGSAAASSSSSSSSSLGDKHGDAAARLASGHGPSAPY